MLLWVIQETDQVACWLHGGSTPFIFACVASRRASQSVGSFCVLLQESAFRKMHDRVPLLYLDPVLSMNTDFLALSSQSLNADAHSWLGTGKPSLEKFKVGMEGQKRPCTRTPASSMQSSKHTRSAILNAAQLHATTVHSIEYSFYLT
jgi:hypothetical protein